MKKRRVIAIVCLSLLALLAGSSLAATPDEATLRSWVQKMKNDSRGPFKHIRWFCNDGTIQLPKEYACSERGGGVQHGEWTDRVKRMRAGGYYIANVLAALDPEQIISTPGYSDLYNQILIEKFFIAADNGGVGLVGCSSGVDRNHNGPLQRWAGGQGAGNITNDRAPGMATIWRGRGKGHAAGQGVGNGNVGGIRGAVVGNSHGVS